MKKPHAYPFIFSLLLLLLTSALNAQSIILLQQNKPVSIRGLSVVDDKVAWVSGSNGYIAITTNGGKNWNWQQIKGFEKADFRDIEAFSDRGAVIMSSGTPALILKTIDGGLNWQVKYNNTDTTFFLDAMDFDTPQHGLILGDPINKKFLLLETNDSGETWKSFKDQPDALPDEASFAASGTCLRVINRNIFIATGGNSSRLLSYSVKKGWTHKDLPIIHGKASQGAFSLAIGINKTIFVGGDYVNDQRADSVAANYSGYPFNLLPLPVKQPAGFQSCVEAITNNTFLSTGTSGTNITTDGGKTWAKIDATSFNVCRKAKHGKLVLLAGNAGKIGIFKL